MRAALFVVMLLIGWEAAWWAGGVRPMLPGSLKALKEGGSGDSVRIVDVRTRREYEWFHIPGAESRPEALVHPETVMAEPRDAHLVFVCLSGHRAPVAAFRMKKLGFHRVSYVTWGMLAWMLSGGPTVSGGAGG